jgi:hypothetical protein
MNSIKIAIIEDDRKEFFRLQEQIRSRAQIVDKIYACRFPSEFFELSNWKDCTLVIAENELGGRPDAGLQFFRELFKANEDTQTYGLLYTWGTNDYNAFRIRIHSLHQRYPHFLGAIFKQIGDYDKIFEIIQSIHSFQPYPIFDQPLTEGAGKDIEEEQRKDSEKLIDLHHRIQERLLFFIQLVRFHLERRVGLDFQYTLKEFPGYSEHLLGRLSALSKDVEELTRLIETIKYLNEVSESETANQDSAEPFPIITENGKINPAHFTGFNSIVEFFLKKPDAMVNGPAGIEAQSRLQEFLKNYEEFSYNVSRLVDTMQLAVKNKNNHANAWSADG